MKLDAVPIVDVWHQLGGDEPRHGRARAFWRDGKNLSVSLSIDRNAWYDHRDGRGGGSLDLVKTALGCDQRAALRWLEVHAGLDPLHSTPEERRQYTAAKERAELSAPRIADFVNGLRIIVERKAALAGFLLEAGVEVPETVAIAHQYAYLLDGAEPEDIISVTRDNANRKAFEALERIGREDRENAELWTAVMGGLLAIAEERESLYDRAHLPEGVNE